MSRFRCMVCGTEYDTIPVNCTTPGCGNNNPALFEVIEEAMPPEPDENERIYNEASAYAASNNLDELKRAIELFSSIYTFRDASRRANECKAKLNSLEQALHRDNSNDRIVQPNNSEAAYISAMELYKTGTLQGLSQAKNMFLHIPGYKDSREMIKQCDRAIQLSSEAIYAQAKQLYSQKDYARAKELFESIIYYKNSAQMIQQCQKKLEHKPGKGLIIFLIILITVVLGIGTILALQFFVLSKIPDPTPKPQPKPTAAVTTVAETAHSVQPEVDSITFYRKQTKDDDYVEAENYLYENDYQCKIEYLFKNVNELINTDASIKVAVMNPDKDTIAKDMTLYFKDLNDRSTGWRTEFEMNQLEAGKLLIKIYSEQGELIADNSIEIIAETEKTTEKTIKKKYNSVKELFEEENLSKETTVNGINSQIFASAENVLLYQFTYMKQVDEKEIAKLLSENESDLASSLKETMDNELKPFIDSSQWDKIIIYCKYCNQDGAIIKWYQYTIKNGLKTLI